LKCLLHKIPSTASRPIFYEVPMSFTLRNALEGKQVIEYPSFIIGPEEFLTKVEYFVKELSNSERSEGEDKEKSSPTVATKRQRGDVTGSCDPNEIDLVEAGSAKQQRLIPLPSDDEEDGEEQHIERGRGASMAVPVMTAAEMEESSEGEEDDDGGGEEFIKQLELLQSQDISSLHQLIASMETQS
jgi:hypothetical protein